jgi:hypothetical protein
VASRNKEVDLHARNATSHKSVSKSLVDLEAMKLKRKIKYQIPAVKEILTFNANLLSIDSEYWIL